MPDNFAVRLAARLLGPQWKQMHDRKKWLGRRTVLSDCRLMLRYALDEGCRISDQLAKDIAAIDTALIAAGRESLSEVPRDLLQKANESSPPAAINDLILNVHNALADLVAPATAQSLRATDPAVVSLGLPWIAKVAILGALVCTGSFLYFIKKEEALRNPPPQSNTASAQPSATASPLSKGQ